MKIRVCMVNKSLEDVVGFCPLNIVEASGTIHTHFTYELSAHISVLGSLLLTDNALM